MVCATISSSALRGARNRRLVKDIKAHLFVLWKKKRKGGNDRRFDVHHAAPRQLEGKGAPNSEGERSQLPAAYAVLL
jgi:hypothetical protein